MIIMEMETSCFSAPSAGMRLSRRYDLKADVAAQNCSKRAMPYALVYRFRHGQLFVLLHKSILDKQNGVLTRAVARPC